MLAKSSTAQTQEASLSEDDDETEDTYDGTESSWDHAAMLANNKHVKEKKVLNRKLVSTLWLSEDLPITIK